MFRRRLKKYLKLFIKTSRISCYLYFYYHAKIQNNTILIESKSGQDLAGNMFYILKYFSQNDEYKSFKKYLIINKTKQKQITTLLNKYNICNVEIIVAKSLKYYKKLATAKFLFNDTSLPFWFIKKEGQQYINTWHGTPLKKMGRDVPTGAYDLGNIQRNFLMADYLVFPNRFMQDKMIRAYMLENISINTKILSEGYPRNEIFFDKERATQLKKEIGLGDKQVIIYMPTWRGKLTEKKNKKQIDELRQYFEEIDTMLTDKQILYVKFHVFFDEKVSFKSYKHIKAFPKEYETYDFLNMSDCLITDYSSVLFDYANSGKKIILFTYDVDEYLDDRGLYIRREKLPFPITTTAKEVVQEINIPKEYDDKEFLETYCTYDNKIATERLCRFVIYGLDDIKIQEIPNNNKENILIYTGGLHKNGLTTSLLNLMSVVNLKEKNYLFTYRTKNLSKFSERIQLIPEDVNYIPLKGNLYKSFYEVFVSKLYYKYHINNFVINRRLNRYYERELKRNYGFANIHKFIHFTGYDKEITSLIQRAKTPKIIYVHNDMMAEIKSKGNQHLLTLKEAYTKYTKVAVVTEDIRQCVDIISEGKASVSIVNNCHDFKGVIARGNQLIQFDNDTEININRDRFISLMASNVLKFITIGRFSSEKGHIRLMNAFSKFSETHKDACLIIIGGYGAMYQKTLNYAKGLSCFNDIIIIRSISNPVSILKKCDLFILSSFYEGLGLVILEADTVGVPVISTDIPGPRKFMQKYNGYLVDNSEQGILQGMYDFMDGKVKTMNIDFEEYNKQCNKQFESLLEDTK